MNDNVSLVAHYYVDRCGQSRIVYFGWREPQTKAAVDPQALPQNHPELDLRT